MATLAQILFNSMIILILVFLAIIILILALTFTSNLSEVTSPNSSPIANITQDVVLSCKLHPKDSEKVIREVVVTWQKEGLQGDVYRYKGGAPDLGSQNSQFKGRTQLFPEALDTGNASLLLRGVRRSDEGLYTCSVTSSNGGGEVEINLKTAAFTAPTFNFSRGILSAAATRWFPKPNVSWEDQEGNLLNGTTDFTENSAAMFSLASRLTPGNDSDTYTCRIENKLVTAFSMATLAGSEVTWSTYFIYSTASSPLASINLSIMAVVFCTYRLL